MTRLAPSSPPSQLIEPARALLAGVVDVGEAEQVPGDFAGRDSSGGTRAPVDACRAERPCARRPAGAPAPRDIGDKRSRGRVATRPGQLEQSPRLGPSRRRGQLIRSSASLSSRGLTDDRIDRGADRERLAVAVGHRAAMCGDLYRAQMAVVRLRGEELLVDELQIEDSALECRGAEREQREQHRPRQRMRSTCCDGDAFLTPKLISVTRRRPVARRPDSSGGGARARAIRSAGAWPRCSARSAAVPSRSGAGPARR